MSERAIEDQSLRERMGHADQLLRELSEHLNQSFLPKLRAASDLVRSGSGSVERDDIADSTVRTAMSALIKSDNFTQTLIEKLDPYLSSIHKGVEQVLEGS
ncbi:MAG: hypothetical protein NT069_10005 [Planctomycetota bacterium]|nr:hypothetical protein [Planctomycetota bacterium]